MTRNVVKYGCAVMALLFVTGVAMPSPAAAQGGSVNVAGGYSLLRDEGQNFSKGWFASVGGGISSWLEVVGEASGNYRTFSSIEGDELDARIHSFLAGPRFVADGGRVHPFAQVLFGVARASAEFDGESISDSAFAWQPGGGIDFDLTRNVGVRTGVNGRFIRDSGNGLDTNEFQFVVGVVFRR